MDKYIVYGILFLTKVTATCMNEQVSTNDLLLR